MDQITIDWVGLCKLIENLKPTSPGIDGITSQFLKCSATYSSLILSSFFSQSLECSVLPSDWKVGRVVPVPKESLALVRSSSLKILPAMLVSWLSAVVSASPGITYTLPIAAPSTDKLDATPTARTCCVIVHELHASTELAFLRTGQWTTASSAREDLSSWRANTLFSGHGSSAFGAAPNRQLFIMQMYRAACVLSTL
ncbi:uncharacterized protein LOC144173187 [Haemaphysalis longicornis]